MQYCQLACPGSCARLFFELVATSARVAARGCLVAPVLPESIHLWRHHAAASFGTGSVRMALEDKTLRTRLLPRRCCHCRSCWCMIAMTSAVQGRCRAVLGLVHSCLTRVLVRSRGCRRAVSLSSRVLRTTVKLRMGRSRIWMFWA